VDGVAARRRLVVLYVAVLLGGCSVRNPEGEARSASDAPAPPAESARFEATFQSASGKPLPKKLRGGFEGEIAKGGTLVDMTFDDESIGHGPELELIHSELGSNYLRAPGRKGLFPKGKKWVRLDDEELAESFPPFVEVLSLVGTDKLLVTGGWEGFPGAQSVGSDEVRRVPTTKFHVSADVDELEQEAPDLSDQVEDIRAFLGDELAFDVWVDDDGHIRRMALAVPGARFEAVGAVVVIDVFDFDDPGIDIEAPPPDEVVDQ
jgi:hypothetical protein